MKWTNAVSGSSRQETSSLIATGGSDSTVRIWDIESCSCKMVLQGHTSAILSMAFSPDNKILAATSFSGDIILWSLHE